MKISYILQLKDFSIMIGIGFILGIIYGLLNLFSIVKKNIVLQIISDLIFSILLFFTFVVAINKINMGEFRAFLFVGYLFGLLIERITLGKLFAKGFKCVYNKLIIMIKKFASSKFGRMLLK